MLSMTRFPAKGKPTRGRGRSEELCEGAWGLAEVLDYARAATPPPTSRWPLVFMATITVVVGSALLAKSCVFGVGHAAAKRRWQREEAWACVLGQGSGCLL